MNEVTEEVVEAAEPSPQQTHLGSNLLIIRTQSTVAVKGRVLSKYNLPSGK